MALPLFGNSDHVVASLSIDFPLNSKQDAPFHCIAHDYSCASKKNFMAPFYGWGSTPLRLEPL